MEFRLAQMKDLPQLKAVFQTIVDNMHQNNIRIWNEIYPAEVFQNDIKNKSLYILTENDTIIAAFVLCESSDGERYFGWNHENAHALYLYRFGVSADYARKGIGGFMLHKAKEVAKKRSAEFLRLLAADINQPAIDFYLKNGFQRVDGMYEEKIENGVLREYGFETEV